MDGINVRKTLEDSIVSQKPENAVAEPMRKHFATKPRYSAGGARQRRNALEEMVGIIDNVMEWANDVPTSFVERYEVLYKIAMDLIDDEHTLSKEG